MRAVVQRVREASVAVENTVVGSIGRGLLVLLGLGKDDSEADIPWMVQKIINLRIFEKEAGKFDESLLDIGGELLIISQFTLYGDCSRGRRPSFSEAMGAEDARGLFSLFIDEAKKNVARVETGIFQANMDVSLINEGPVTIIVDSNR